MLEAEKEKSSSDEDEEVEVKPGSKEFLEELLKEAEEIIDSCDFVVSLNVVPESKGKKWKAVIKGAGSYAGLNYKLEISFYKSGRPLVRFTSLIEHPNLDDLGYPDDKFYENIPFSATLTEMIIEAHALLANPKTPTPHDVDYILKLWKNHDPNCFGPQCHLFPFSYEDLMTHSLENQLIYLKNIKNKVNMQISRQFWSQVNYSKNRIHTILNYKPKHPELFDVKTGWKEEWFDPSFYEALKKGKPKDFEEILKEEIPGVYSFKIFTLRYCDMLMEEVDNFENSNFPKQRPNSMNNYGVILNNIGMEPMFDLFLEYIRPLSRMLFVDDGGATIDHHHTFIVDYKIGQDLNLDMHIDDSEVTVNVNLLDTFSGSTLNFCGMQNKAGARKLNLAYNHKKGVAVIHSGKHRHGAADITGGSRSNLIVWCRSSAFRESPDFVHRNRSFRDNVPPDLVCLSETHDRDYEEWRLELTGTATG